MFNIKFNVLISASTYISRKGLSAIISSLPEGNFIEAERGPWLEQLKSASKPIHLLVHEVEGGESDLSEQIAQITRCMDARVLLIIDKIEKNRVQKYIKAGVKGIITRQCSKEEIINAISTTLKDDLFLCSKVLNVLVHEVKEDAEPRKTEIPLLSKRELEVLTHITKGHSTMEIADLLNISVHTVNSHRKNILRKLNLKSPMELIVYAIENGLVEKG